MSNLNHADIVKQQYATETNLNTRIAIHENVFNEQSWIMEYLSKLFSGYGMEESTNKISHFKMEAKY